MKKVLFLLWLVLSFLTVSTVNATLWDRGGGLIYDDVLNVTWLQDANYAQTSNYRSDGRMTWNEAVVWAENLSYYDSIRNITWTDWRLPKTLPINGGVYNMAGLMNGSTDTSYNVSALGSVYSGSTASEMAYMFYNNLGNKAAYDIYGNEQTDYGLINTGPFSNLLPYWYWSESRNETFIPNYAFDFDFTNGNQRFDDHLNYLRAWAVRDGDVKGGHSAPEPVTLLLYGLGFAGAGLYRRMRKPK